MTSEKCRSRRSLLIWIEFIGTNLPSNLMPQPQIEHADSLSDDFFKFENLNCSWCSKQGKLI